MKKRARLAGAGYLLILGSGLGFCQPPAAQPAFEVASIKSSDPAATIAIHRSGHRITTIGTSLQFLIAWAYDIHADRIYAKPKWLDSTRFDVIAGAERDETGEWRQMMQTLLAERFHLVVHRETRELSIYALVVAKGGPRVHLSEAPDSMGQNPFRMPSRGLLIGTQVSAEMLAKALSDQLGHSVQDQTGLKGVFDFELSWEPDTAAPAAFGPTAWPPLYTAIQQQLGFRLEASKGAVEVLVIDHIDSLPTEN